MKALFYRLFVPTPLRQLPAHASAKKFLEQERERLLTAFLRVLFVLGLGVELIALPVQWETGQLSDAALYFITVGVCGLLARQRHWFFPLRAGFLLALLYGIGAQQMLEQGWQGEGRIILLATVVLVLLLFGVRAGFAMLVVGVLALFGLKTWQQTQSTAAQLAWETTMMSALVYTLMLCLILVGINTLVESAARAWAREHVTTQLAEQKQEQLVARLQEIEDLHQQLALNHETLEQTVQARTAELRTAVQAAEEARTTAEAANRAKSQFLANMSHELRTPLAIIIGYAEMLNEVLREHLPRQSPKAERVLTAGNHLLNLINDLLDFSSLETNRLELKPETFAVVALLEETLAAFRPTLAVNNNHLEVRIAPNLGMMTSDPARLRQALLNLLQNATKFTRNGTITLTVQRTPAAPTATRLPTPDWLTFRVTDTGIGLSETQLVHLFQPFKQGDASNTRRYDGTGLGLVVSRRLCRMMGGDITVASTPEIGSSFTIHLPAVLPASASPQIPYVRTHISPTQATQGVILVIDDEEAVRELLALTLSQAGFMVETARNGIEGLEKAQALRPAAITLDVLMPEMDGWEFLRQLRTKPELQNTPVVCITVLEHQEQGRHLGAVDYLLKPLDRQGLVKTVSKYRTPGQGRHLLVVDDDVQIREVMYDQLTAVGWQVTLAANGTEALAQIAVQLPSLIVLDLMMPEMDGFQFVTQLRQTPRWRSIPIVVVTALELSYEERERLNGFVTLVLQKTDLTHSAAHLVQNIQRALSLSNP